MKLCAAHHDIQNILAAQRPVAKDASAETWASREKPALDARTAMLMTQLADVIYDMVATHGGQSKRTAMLKSAIEELVASQKGLAR